MRESFNNLLPAIYTTSNRRLSASYTERDFEVDQFKSSSSGFAVFTKID